MKIKQITENKKKYLDLLLIADEDEKMIDKYLEVGDVFILCDDDLKSICVVTDEKDSYELKNLATYPKYQNQGYATKLVNFILNYYKSKSKSNNHKTIYVGTGDVESIISFYEKFGFKISHKIENFFVDNYKEPMFEGNKQLIDMIYLKVDF